MAIAVIAYGSGEILSVPKAARLVQLIAAAPAFVAVYQLATHTGMDVAGNIRANGTLAHPDSAAMFFAIATIASLWVFFCDGRRRIDVALTALFAAAMIATFSIDGLASLIAMLIILGVLYPGAVRDKLIPPMIAGVVVLAFFAAPLGREHVASESATKVASTGQAEETSSFAWRLKKWRSLLDEWGSAPIVGHGLGTSTTNEATPGNRIRADLPHNEYLRYLVETGVVGLTILLGGLAMLAYGLVRRVRMAMARRDTGSSSAGVLGIVVLCGCLVNSLADNTFLDSPTCYVAALIVFAVVRANRNPEQAVRQPHSYHREAGAVVVS